MKDILTTKDAADILGVSIMRVYALIREGRLEATKHGRDWLIKPEALEAVRVRKWGRPKKEG